MGVGFASGSERGGGGAFASGSECGGHSLAGSSEWGAGVIR